MPDVSVLTAFAPRPHSRLAEIHAALDAADREWEWIVQVDGDATAELPVAVTEDPRVRVERNGQPLGIALTRNRGLARVTAPLLLNADSDDVPEPGALDVLADAFDDPTVGLSFGTWREHWPDAEAWAPEIRFPAGRIEPGTISAVWLEERWMPMHLAGAMWRTDAVLAAGGWTALVGGSDIGLMLGVEATWASHYAPVPTFTYHHHADQATAAARWHELFEGDAALLAARARALSPRPADPRR